MDWRGAGVRTGNLLRNTEVWQLDPVTPPMGEPLRRKPVETDPGIVTAVRGQRRPEEIPAEPAAAVARQLLSALADLVQAGFGETP